MGDLGELLLIVLLLKFCMLTWGLLIAWLSDMIYDLPLRVRVMNSSDTKLVQKATWFNLSLNLAGNN
jgi:hypothetical protein